MSRRRWTLLALVVVFYFAALYPFYAIDYFVPDHFLYYGFALAGLPAKDGFSSLFLVIAGMLGRAPVFLNLLVLVFLAMSLIGFGIAAGRLGLSKSAFALAVLLPVSTSCFYYFYGKTFYDFPFIAVVYAVALLLAVNLMMCWDAAKDWKKYALCLLLGFCLSWKPYSLFCVTGLCGLLALSIPQQIRLWLSKCRVFLCLLSFAAGYLSGNFHLLNRPYETWTGIRAYPAHFPFFEFLFTKHRVIWDHVMDWPFNLSGMACLAAAIILFALPLLLRSWRVLLFHLFMVCCFGVFVQNFSPGYAWHGFTFCLFLLTAFLFCLKQGDSISVPSRRRLFFVLACLAVVVQMVTNFGFYLPTEIGYWRDTHTAVLELRTDGQTIREELEKETAALDGTYDVICDLKRYHFIGDKGRYPLFISKVRQLDNVFSSSRFVSAARDKPQYVLRVQPHQFLKKRKAAEVYPIWDGGGYEMVRVIEGEHHRIEVYRLVDAGRARTDYLSGDIFH